MCVRASTLFNDTIFCVRWLLKTTLGPQTVMLVQVKDLRKPCSEQGRAVVSLLLATAAGKPLFIIIIRDSMCQPAENIEFLHAARHS